MRKARDYLATLAATPANPASVPAEPFIAPGLPETLAEVLRKGGPAPDALLTLKEAGRLDRWQLPPAPAAASVSNRDRQTSLRGYLSGRLALGDGDMASAVTRLRQSSVQNPSAPEPLRVLGEALLASGDPRGAAQAFRQAAPLSPLPPRVLAFLAQESIDRGEHAEAVAFSLEAVRAEARNPEAGLAPVLHRTLAGALDRLGYHTAARDALTLALDQLNALEASSELRLAPEATALRRQRSMLLVELGDAEFRAGRPERALDAYTLARREPGASGADIEPRIQTAAVAAGRPWIAVEAALDSLGEGKAHLNEPRRQRLLAATSLPKAREPLLAAIREWRDEVAGTSPALAARLSLAALALLPHDQAHRGLAEHLIIAPDDSAAATQWLDGITPVDGAPSELATLLSQSPEAGETLARCITASARGPEVIAALRKDAGPTSRWLVSIIRSRLGAFADTLELTRGGGSSRMLLVRGIAAADAGDLAIAREARDALARTSGAEAIEAASRVSTRMGDPAWAIEHLETLLGDRTLPSATRRRALVVLAEARAIAGDARGSLAALDQVLLIDPEHERALALRLAITEPGGPAPDASAAARAVRGLQNLGDSTRELVIARAREHLRHGRWDSSLRALEPLLASDPVDPAALPIAVDAHEARATALPSAAIEAARKFGELADRLDSPLLRLAEVRVMSVAIVAQNGRDSGLDQEAARILAKLDALQATPLRWPPELHDRRLVLLVQSLQGDTPEPVRRAADWARTQHPSLKGLPYLRAAAIADRLGRPRVTLAMLDASLEISDSLEPSVVVQALRLIPAVGDAPLAKRVLDRAQAQGLLSDAVLGGGRAGEPTLTDARAELAYTMGSSAWNHRRDAEAMGLLQLALDYDPGHAWAANDLGYFLADAGRELERAEKLLKIAYAELPTTASIIDSLAWLRYKQARLEDFTDPATGQRQLGARSLLIAASQTPDGADNPALFDHLGDTLWRLGDRQGALAAWDAAERLLPRRLAMLDARRDQIEGEGAFIDTRARIQSVQAKLAAGRNGLEPPVALQGEHAHSAPATSDPSR